MKSNGMKFSDSWTNSDDARVAAKLLNFYDIDSDNDNNFGSYNTWMYSLCLSDSDMNWYWFYLSLM